MANGQNALRPLPRIQNELHGPDTHPDLPDDLHIANPMALHQARPRERVR